MTLQAIGIVRMRSDRGVGIIGGCITAFLMTGIALLGIGDFLRDRMRDAWRCPGIMSTGVICIEVSNLHINTGTRIVRYSGLWIRMVMRG